MLNIVYLHTHDSGRCMEPYGYPVRTPHLMQLARGGTLFRQAYTSAPTCSPSRASMLTGVFPHECGMLGLVHRGFSLTDEARERHLARWLQRHGYETVLSGVQHEWARGDEQALGYTRVLDVTRDQGRDVDVARAEAAVAYLREPKSQPFFLALGLDHTHRTFPELPGGEDAPSDTDPRYVMPFFPFYDTSQNREDAARFNHSMHIADECIGKVLAALQATGLDEKTIILYTTDHGIAFPHCKCNLYDTGIGVALMLRYPGNPSAGKAVDALVSQLDVYPTLCELAGVPAPAGLQGHSLVPVMEDGVEQVRSEVFSEVSYHAGYDPQRSVRTERYKLIRLYHDHNRPVPVNIDDGPTKSFMIEAGLLNERRDKEMLFDLYLDPVERVNRVDDPAYAAVYRDLSRRLDDWMARTNDPLVQHQRVPKPPDARIHRDTCVSNTEQDFE